MQTENCYLLSTPPLSSLSFLAFPCLLQNTVLSQIESNGWEQHFQGEGHGSLRLHGSDRKQRFSLLLDKHRIWAEMITHAWVLCWSWAWHSQAPGSAAFQLSNDWDRRIAHDKSNAFMRGRGEGNGREIITCMPTAQKSRAILGEWEFVDTRFCKPEIL